MSRSDLEYVRKWAAMKISSCEQSLDNGSVYIDLRQSVDSILAKIGSDMPPRDGLLERPPALK
jgi:hypothetical protein